MNTEDYNSHDEISMKDIILTIQKYFNELKKNWLILFLFALPIFGYFLYKTFNTPVKFEAGVTYIVEGESNKGLGGIGGLLGSFVGKSSTGVNPNKILEVSKSRRIIKRVLFAKSKATNEFLINDIIASYKLDEKWEEDNPEMKGFRFKHDSIALMTPNERSAFKTVSNQLIGSKKQGGILRINLDEDTGVFNIDASSINEMLSLQLVQEEFIMVKEFFEEKVFEEKENTRELLKFKMDSLNYLIENKALQVARFEDRSYGMIGKESTLGRDKLILEIQGLSKAYAEATKSYELSDFELRNNKPLFLTIEEPMLPLIAQGQDLKRNIILGFILTFLLGGGFIVLRKIYRDIMS